MTVHGMTEEKLLKKIYEGFSFFLKKNLLIYLAAPGLSCRIFTYSIQTLS